MKMNYFSKLEKYCKPLFVITKARCKYQNTKSKGRTSCRFINHSVFLVEICNLLKNKVKVIIL